MPATPERFCPVCHVVTTEEACPQCHSKLAKLIERAQLASSGDTDHRGIQLPARHAVGGIITPR